jgi:FlaA1/EpsC-like NDP-sugar epimerase
MSSRVPGATAGYSGTSQNGEFVSNGAPGGSMPPRQGDIARRRQRISRTTAELSYDITVWVCGMLAVAWVTRDLADTVSMQFFSVRVAAAVCVISPASGLLAGLYQSKYQRGSLAEVVGVGTAAVGTCAALGAATIFLVRRQHAPLATVAGAAVFAVLAMLGARYVLFAVRQRIPATVAAPAAVKVIVFGAGEAGSQLVHSLLTHPDAEYRPVAILDDDPDKRRLRVFGVPVLGDRAAMAQAAATTGAKVLVIAIARASGTAIRDLTAQAEQCGLVPKVVPSIAELLSGVERIEGVRHPRISDLLGRRPVQTDVASVAGYFAGKRILVTGAGGSIGSELCRQLHRFQPAELIMVDRDESALHAVQLALHGRALLDSDGSVLADIRDRRRIKQVFEQFQPQIVFHAAALKHLPLLERYPAEALKTNVWGTCTVLEAAAACGVESFVNISTDKAADPVSVLGYSKRAAERLTAHIAGQAAGTYLSVRFGNVLGSRGSVLTALSAQVTAGGPVTVTHPEVTRYFMTADEAVQLVLQAAVIGRDGEVLVLDMGEQIRIADMAHRLAAAVPRQVDIIYTGLRPGEKLTEVLLGEGEQDERPYHPLIRHVPVSPLPPGAVLGLDPDDALAGLRKALGDEATRTLGGNAAGPPGQVLPLAPARRPSENAQLTLGSPWASQRERHRLSRPPSTGPPGGRSGR